MISQQIEPRDFSYFCQKQLAWGGVERVRLGRCASIDTGIGIVQGLGFQCFLTTSEVVVPIFTNLLLSLSDPFL